MNETFDICNGEEEDLGKFLMSLCYPLEIKIKTATQLV